MSAPISVEAPPPTLLRALKAGISPVNVISGVSGSAPPLPFATLAEALQSRAEEHWKDRVVLVTGAANGIGKEVVKAAARLGAKVVLGDLSRQEKRLKEVVEEIKAEGGDAICGLCDVTSWEEQNALFKLAFSTYGLIDVVFANAGITSVEPKPDLRTLDINLSGVSKHAVLGFARSLAAPFAASGVSISLLCPFYVTTTILPQTWIDAFKQVEVPLLSPEEVAQAGLWVAMDTAGKEGEKVSAKAKAVLLDHLGATSIPLEMVEWKR
ncbi:hypothetical protein JCM11251_000907 [Rhodosporidiobolus azoricus]